MNDVCYRKITLAHQNHDFVDITAYKEAKADSTMVTCLSQTSEITDLVLRCQVLKLLHQRKTNECSHCFIHIYAFTSIYMTT